MEGFHGPMLYGGRGLSPVASTPDSSAADWAKEEKAPCEVLAMPCFPDAENWDMAHEGKVGCVVRSYASHNGRAALVTLFTACNPEQGPTVTSRLSLKLQSQQDRAGYTYTSLVH